MLRQCSIIFICLAIAELIVHATHINFPSSLLGMLILTFSIKTGLVKLEWVKGFSDFLLSHLGLFFVPPGVALMLYFGVIQAQLIPIALATLGSMLLVLLTTGWTYQLIRKIL